MTRAEFEELIKPHTSCCSTEQHTRELADLLWPGVQAQIELVPLARALWQMVDDSDIGHRALRPETKKVIDRAAQALASLQPPREARP